MGFQEISLRFCYNFFQSKHKLSDLKILKDVRNIKPRISEIFTNICKIVNLKDFIKSAKCVCLHFFFSKNIQR